MWRRLQTLSLRAKFITASVAIIVALTSVMIGLVLYQVRRSLEVEVEKRGETLAGQLGTVAEFPLRTGDRAALEKIARDALRLDDVVGLEFFTADGKSLAKVEREDAAGRTFMYSRQVLRQTSAFRDDMDFYTGTGEAERPKVAGSLKLRMSLASADRIVGSIRAIILIAAAVLAALAIILSVHLARRITDPIQKLTKGVEAIGAGRLDVEIDVGEDGEIGALAEHVNQMARNLKKSLDQMIQQEKMATLGRMASCITHEIGSPLNSILIDAHIVREKMPPEEGDGKQSIEGIIEQARRMRDTVRNLLDYARNPPADVENVDLAKALDEALRILAHPLRKAGFKIKQTWPPDLPQVMAIKNLTVQVFVNLITNALEAAGPGGQLNIEARKISREDASPRSGPAARRDLEQKDARSYAGGVEISFRDNGPGIPDDLRDRIFEPFYTTKAPGEGTGLGLTICHHIMQGFGGEIKIGPAADGGSVFILKFQAIKKQSA
jgi:signal transduction histidine kinase